jgi:hypothetical protein
VRNERPLLLVDVDGVLSLFGPPAGPQPDRTAGTWHQVEGIVHLLSPAAAGHLLDLAPAYELVWCTGWEERANEHLPHLLGLPELPVLRFDRGAAGLRATRAHWKLDAIDAHAGPDRAVAWIDDAHDDACRAWADARPGPTLLVTTEPHVGLGDAEAARLAAWAAALPR